jgi:predicted O-methyltransferase YrrM
MNNLAQKKIEEICSSGQFVAEMDKTTHDIFPVAIDPGEGKSLQVFIRDEDPETVIEIGLGYGFAALNVFAAKELPGKSNFRFITIDPNQESGFANIGLQILREIKVIKYVEFYSARSELVLPRLIEEKEKADFAIVDGNHRFEHVFVDLFFLGQLLEPGSLIFLDDLQLPGIKKAVSFFVNNFEWQIEAEASISKEHHWAALRTRSEVLERNYDDFTDF